MSPMRDDELQKAMDTWAESEIECAPDLRPTEEMVRLVRAKQGPRRARSISSGWAVAGAAGLLLIAALATIILRSGAIPGPRPAPEEMLVAQRVGPVEVETAIVKGDGKGEGGKGPVRGQAAFRQLVLEIGQRDSSIVRTVDLLSPPAEILVLTAADNYRLVLEPVEERNVYVYQLTSSGSLVQLFANPAYSALPNPLPPGQLTVLPAEPHWLYLDGAAGEERLYFVACPQPLQGLDDLYAQYGQQPDAASKREAFSDLLDMIQTVPETYPGCAAPVEFVFHHR